MSPSLLVISVIFLYGSTSPAANLGTTAEPKPAPGGVYHGGGRVGGDTVDDAVAIVELPYSDTGVTCGYANDYDAVCPYTGSTAPDVLYRFNPASDQTIWIGLCASQYDTKVYVWEEMPGNTVACNDDASCGYSGWQSRIDRLELIAGRDYFIVVDGYGESCGDYVLEVTRFEPCVVTCPPGALDEGERPCGEVFQDDFNSGCNSGFHWLAIPAQSGGCATLCGKSCTFTYGGESYRDTDWFNVAALGGPLNATCTADFPLLFILIYVTDCHLLQYDFVTADPCQPAHLEYNCQTGQEIWLWAGPVNFDGVADGDYVIEVCGIMGEEQLFGACCTFDGCRMLPESGCTGLWQGAGTLCSPDPCPTWGACCRNEICHLEAWHECHAQDGTWIPEVSCTPNPCVPPTPAQVTSWGRIKAAYR